MKIYKFQSLNNRRKNNPYFNINDDKEFRRFCRNLRNRIDEKHEVYVRKILSKLKKENRVTIDKFYTKLIYKSVHHHWESYSFEEDIRDFSFDSKLSSQNFEYNLVDIVNLIKFHNLIKNSRDGLKIYCTESDDETEKKKLFKNPSICEVI